MGMDIVERRRHRRYRLRGRGMVMVVPHLVFSYAVEDISRGGLAFLYSGWCDWRQETPQAPRITFLDQDCFLDKVPMRIVADQDFPEIVDPDVPRLRRCAVEFGRLSPGHSRILEAYLARLATLHP